MEDPHQWPASEERALRCATTKHLGSSCRAHAVGGIWMPPPARLVLTSTPRPGRLLVAGSALLSVAGTCVVLASVVRFRELSKRFFAIQLITYLVSVRIHPSYPCATRSWQHAPLRR